MIEKHVRNLNFNVNDVHLLPSNWLDTMYTKKFCHKGIFIAGDMLIIACKHPNKNLRIDFKTLNQNNLE